MVIIIMGSIGRGVKACHLFGIVIVVFVCIFSIPCWNQNNIACANDDDFENTDNKKQDGRSIGALTIVESVENADDDGDGIVTVETNGSDEIIEDDESMELFEATFDWKTVKKGQKLPSGLHVRLNLQTGEQEAKLMDDKKQGNKWYAGEEIGVINADKQRYSKDEIKKALKDFKFDDPDPSGKQNKKESEATLEKKKFRSYDELKDALKEMQMSVKTEAEIVTQLVNRLKEPSTKLEDMKVVLHDIEYYLHQVDNARVFCDLKGMNSILKLMNHSDEEIRTKSLLVLGSALQSNSQVQINAIENGMMQQLLKTISLDTSAQVKKKALFALSTLLRQFPYAQSSFLDVDGMSSVNDLFQKSVDESLKIKVITFVTDLVLENDLNYLANDRLNEEKALQYSRVKIRSAIEKYEWCSHISSLLNQVSGHDNIEKVLEAMKIVYYMCQEQFSPLRGFLQSLSSHYENLAKIDREQGETDNYFDSIYSTIEQLLKDIKFQREDL